MTILSITPSQTGLVGVLPSIAYIATNDTIAEVTATGYLNKEVANGAQFSLPCAALVSTQSTPTAAPQVGMYQVVHVGSDWSLITRSIISSGLKNQLAYYPADGVAITGLPTGNSGVLVTDGTGAPSISTTLPSGLSATNMSLVTPTLGVASATSIVFSSTSGIIGTTAGNNAAAGSVGEFLSSEILVGNAISISNATATDLTTIRLTPGDWDVFGNLGFTFTGAFTSIQGWQNIFSVTLPNAARRTILSVSGTNLSQAFPIPRMRYTVSVDTTIYLSGQVAFSTGSATMYGSISARRRR